MFLGGLLDGLIRSSTDAVRAQDGDLHRVLVDVAVVVPAQPHRRRRRGPTVEAVDGVAETGGLGLVQLGARVPGNGPRDLASTALFGYELAPVGVPDAAGPRRGVRRRRAARRRRRGGHGDPPRPGPHAGHGDRVRVRHDVLRAGIAVGRPGTWREVLSANRPDEQLGDDVFQALVVRTADGADVADVAAAIDEATGGATESLTITEAVDAIPGVEQQRSTFNQIIGVTSPSPSSSSPCSSPCSPSSASASTASSRRSAPAAARCSPASSSRRSSSPPSPSSSPAASPLLPRRRHPARLDPARHHAPPDRHQRRPAARRRRRRLRLLPPPGPARRPGLRDRNAS